MLELGGGDLSRSVALAERFPDKHFVGCDYQLSPAAAANRPNADALANLEVVNSTPAPSSFPPARSTSCSRSR